MPRSPARIPVPEFHRRIGYDTRREVEAFRKLAELDVDGCRMALLALVDGLDFSRTDAQSRQIVQLLLDTLQRLNRRLHRRLDEGEIRQTNRVALIEEFADCAHPESARRRFRTGLNRLLADPAPHGPRLHPQVERARRFIEDNYWRRIPLSTVSAALHVSRNYLSRIFRLETGVTLTAYVQRVRLEHATLLLSTGRHSISEIAYRVGYQNYRDFYRNFVKYEKTAPGEFRRHSTAGLGRPAGGTLS